MEGLNKAKGIKKIPKMNLGLAIVWNKSTD